MILARKEPIPVGIDKSKIDAYWPRVSPLLWKVIKRSERYCMDEILNELRTGKSQLTICENGEIIELILITCIVPYANKKVLSIFMIAGLDLNYWIKFLPQVEVWGKSMGCKSVEIIGRPGWQRLLKDQKYELTDVILRKDF